MDTTEFLKVREDFNKLCEEILTAKGESYAREDMAADRLGNFKRTAAYVGCDPLQVAFVFFMKHIDSLSKWITEVSRLDVLQHAPSSSGGESVMSRMADIRNYIDIIEAIADERALLG